MLTKKPRPFLIRSTRECFYRIYNPTKKIYYFLFRPRVDGVKVLLENDNRLLMVRIGYAHRCWVFPGGKIDRGETPLQAAARELREETGLTVTNLVEIGKLDTNAEYKKVTVTYFCGETTNTNIVIDDQEIKDAGWFTLDKLPLPHRPKLPNEIEMYKNWKYESKGHSVGTDTKKSSIRSEDELLAQESAERVANCSTKRLTHNQVWGL